MSKIWDSKFNILKNPSKLQFFFMDNEMSFNKISYITKQKKKESKHIKPFLLYEVNLHCIYKPKIKKQTNKLTKFSR